MKLERYAHVLTLSTAAHVPFCAEGQSKSKFPVCRVHSMGFRILCRIVLLTTCVFIVKNMARPGGLELPTFWFVGGNRATQQPTPAYKNQ
jgi:hypothetical protein